ncbi:MAG: hypothetical protein ABI743_10370 [bacterium]
MRGAITTGTVVGLGLLSLALLGATRQSIAVAGEEPAGTVPVTETTLMLPPSVADVPVAAMEWPVVPAADISDPNADRELQAALTGDLTDATRALEINLHQQASRDLAAEAERLIECLRTSQP